MFKTEAAAGNGDLAQAPSPSLRLRPCYFIGTGGTGHRIVLYLKALFLRAYGEIPPGIRLVVFDTDDESLSATVDGHTVSLERDSEFFYIGKVPVASIIHNIDNLPTIRERLPAVESLPPLALLDGAGQNRTLGLLALLWHYDLVQREIRDTLWELSHRENLGRIGGLRIDASRGLQIFPCGSLCGGTNSGQILDQAYLVRSELERLGELADFSKIVGLGMLPDAFRNVRGPNLEPNTIAALRELNTVMTKGGFRANYRNGHSVDTPRPPFDLYYVLGAVAEDGRVQLSRDELCRTAALGLYHLALTPIGGRQRSVFDNVTDVLSHRTGEGHGTFLGSFGVAEVAFPADAIADWCRYRHAADVIRSELLIRHDEYAGMEKDIEAAIQGASLTSDQLLQQLAVDDTDLPLSIDLTMPGWVRDLDPHQVPPKLINWVDAVRRERVEGDFRIWIDENTKQLRQDVIAALVKRINTVVDERGLVAGQSFAEALSAHLDQLTATLTARRQTLEARRGDLAATVEHTSDDLVHAAQAGVVARLLNDPLPQAAGAYLRASEAHLDVQLERVVVDRAVSLAVAAHEQVRARLRALSALVERLQSTAQESSHTAAALYAEILPAPDTTTSGGVHSTNLSPVDEQYLEHLYTTHAGARQTTLEMIIEDTAMPLHAWSDWSRTDMRDALLEAAGRHFASIRAITIEDAIQARAGQLSPRQRRSALVEMARPAWNLEETRLPHGGARLARFELLGVPDADNSIYGADGDRLVSTSDPQRMTAFSMTAGIPMGALRSYSTYLQRYTRLRETEGAHMLHVVPDLHTGTESAKLALGLGLVFDIIDNRRADYYYQPTDPLDDERYLGRGTQQVLDRLATDLELAREVTTRAHEHVDQIGLKDAQAQLDAFCQPAPRDDEAVRSVKRAVREYARDVQA